jgi:hypothetical protein
VVVSGQFLVDSEANLKAATSRMDAMPASGAAGASNASAKPIGGATKGPITKEPEGTTAGSKP